MTTIEDVARRAGVSPATASRALRDRPGVRQASRERVKLAAEELGYRHNLLARALVEGRTLTIGLAVPDPRNNPYWGQVSEAVRRHAGAAWYDTLVMYYGWSSAEFLKTVVTLQGRRVDGLLVSTVPRLMQAYLDRQPSPTTPLVCLDEFGNGETPAGVPFRVDAGYQATRHLLSLGHRRIAFLCMESDEPDPASRAAGYCRAMAEAGLKVHIVPGRADLRGGWQAMAALLRSTPRPTAVFMHNDIAAVGALRALAEAQVRVPDEMSIVGYDNIELSHYCTPALTTVDTHAEDLARAAVEHLLRLVEAGAAEGPPQHLPPRPVLVVRESSGPCPAGS